MDEDFSNQTRDKASSKATGSAGKVADGNATKSNAVSIPQITLPKGGGALKGIDEKFQVNAANGSASFSIPVPVTPGRNGFQPALAVGYNSGTGNSAYGLGWNIEYHAIQRKTDRKLPKYEDETDGDTFMFSGIEDLVPLLIENNGNWQEDILSEGTFLIKRYRPRIEGLFARIEKVKQQGADGFYWKVTTRDNVVTFFGKSGTHRITDPEDQNKIFKWFPELSFDDKGNCMVYEYKEEDLARIENTLYEKNRFSGKAKFTNRYLKRIKYGNIQPYYPDFNKTEQIYNSPNPEGSAFLFEVVFDYGEHVDDQPTEADAWLKRPDPFSEYRPGFEIRTYRICQRILMFHHFTNEEFGILDVPAEERSTRVPYLVRSLDFTYGSSSQNSPQQSELTYLKSIKQTGYKKEGSGYIRKSLPAMEFEYEQLQWNKEVKTITKENIVHDPVGLTSGYQWVDFYGEGISGILTEQADAWYYKSNLGDGVFTEARRIAPKPSFTGLATGILQVQDLDADGKRQVVWTDEELQGYFELTDDNEWLPFRSLGHRLNVDLRDRNTRLIDLNGDGRPDLVISEENVFTWYPSKGTKGYDKKETAHKPYDEEKGPAVVFADDTESIFLADMNGDGLTDIVRIRNGELAYWPNMGYGKFGAKVAMSDAPWFDHPEQYNPAYIHLADVSGTGATDVLYLGKNKFRAWINLSGNAWSGTTTIEPFWPTAPPNELTVTDLLGNGTSCIVWSSPLPAQANFPMQYIDLMGGKKPHIMRKYENNLGKETVLEYKSSTQFYLDDKKAGKPWITKLPFPVQCVSQIVVIDTVTDLRFTGLYSYHHGFYDHEEREFRGFGLVEQKDTEEYEYLKNKNATNATDIQFHEPPVLTKTWFHTGAFLRKEKILNHYVHEYWYNQEEIKQRFGAGVNLEFPLPDALLPADLTTEELMEAHRACKGMVLRQEIFSLDGSDKEKIPFSVGTHNCHIKKLQPKGKSNHAVFLAHESEAITFSYERNVNDPRIAHTLNLEIDDLGNVLKSAAAVYPRKIRPADLSDNRILNEQTRQHIILTEARFTEDVKTPSAYRLRLPCETKTFELTGIEPGPGKGHFLMENLNVAATEIGYEKEPTTGAVEKRLIEHIKVIYLKNDLINAMPECTHDSLGLTFESYQLAFTPALVENIYSGNVSVEVNAPMLLEAKYVHLGDNSFWIRSGTVQYASAGETAEDAAQRFFIPLSYADPFGAVTTVTFDPNYSLLLQETKDAMENTVTAEAIDFRILSPQRIKDANANIAVVAFDMLGMVAGTAIMGKGNEGDNLINFEPDLTQPQVDAFLNDPFAQGKDLLKGATSRIVYDYSKVPCVAASIVREEHEAVQPDSDLQYSFQYSDGLGNVTLTKVMAEPGDAPHRDENGQLVKNPDGSLHLQPTLHRWVGNGRTVLNNKGKPVKQYEPYFSDTHLYEVEPDLREMGVTPVLHYDAAGRLVKTLMPDDTFSKIEYDSWLQKTFDANDTVLESKWFTDRINNLLDDVFRKAGKDPAKEKAAAQKAAVHADTPAIIHLDSLGRAFFAVAHNRYADFSNNNTLKEEFYATQTVLDIEGNIRAVTDAAGNTVMAYKYDMLGHQVYQDSMDAGERWVLNDSMGQPKFSWDSKEQQFTTTYDDLHRPINVTLEKRNNSTIIERFEYKDTKVLTAAELQQNQNLNLIGKIVKHYDGAGVVRFKKYDFKTNLEETSRQLFLDYKKVPNWTNATLEVLNEVLEPEEFITLTSFDALNRPVSMHTPHTPDPLIIPATVIMPLYNEANLLNAVRADLRSSNTETDFVRNIDYDAKGQRISILYANDTVTKYTYDTRTFRLIRLLTTGNLGNTIIQDIHYTYDPVGNITHIEDRSQEPVFFNNERILPLSEYSYDAVNQLIQAIGREHIGQNKINETTTNKNFRNFPFDINPNDVQALRQYTQQYKYDAVGNICKLKHSANGGSYTRTYQYNNNDSDRNALSIDANTRKNNQLLATTVADTTTRYTHDMHGNMLNLPHLQSMVYDFRDQLQFIDLGGGGKAFYVYDAAGQRIRKVIERDGGMNEQRIYLSNYEWFRQIDNAAAVQEATETVHIMDDTRRIALVETKTIKDGAPLSSNNPESRLIRYQYSNHLGSSSLELNDNGTVISYEEYHPYGTTSYLETNKEIKAAAKRYRFTGMERDEESGLAYHTARLYVPWLGRWLSCDPIGLNGGNNLFSYCHDNPIIKIDPSGLDEDEWCFTPGCGEPAIGEYAKEMVVGAAQAIVEPGAKVIDMASMYNALTTNPLGIALYKEGLIKEPLWTCLSSECKNYDPQRGYLANVGSNIYNNTVGGVKNMVEGVGTGNPRAIGALGVVAYTMGRGNPGGSGPIFRIPVPSMPRLAPSQSSAAAMSTAKSMALLLPKWADVGGPILATSLAGSGSGPQGGGSSPDPKVKVQRLRPDEGNKEQTRIKPSTLTAQPKGGWRSFHDEDALSGVGMNVRGAYPRSPLHHMIPQELLKFPAIKRLLKKRRIDIHEYTLRISEGEHSAIHSAINLDTLKKNFNLQWREFFRNNPQATKKQILGFMENLRTIYKIGPELQYERYKR